MLTFAIVFLKVYFGLIGFVNFFISPKVNFILSQSVLDYKTMVLEKPLNSNYLHGIWGIFKHGEPEEELKICAFFEFTYEEV